MEYALKENLFIFRDEDRPKHERNLKRYFESSYKVFLTRMEQFREQEGVPNAEEEKEIRFMVEALLEAKQLLYGEK